MQPANSSQLLLLADHIKLALLDRDRAPNPSAHDTELSRSLSSLRTELEHLESSGADPLTAADLRRQYEDLAADFADKTARTSSTDPSSNPDSTSTNARPPLTQSSSSYKKSVRFSDNPADSADADRAALLPYSDGEDEVPDHSERSNEQIYAYHDNVMREQDGQLDELGRSVGRQRELSIQIGSELDEHSHMLDDVEGHVDRHQTQLDRARGRLGKIARKAKDNLQITVIAILVIVLILLVIILK